MSKHTETFHTIELQPGTYFCGRTFPSDREPDGIKVEWGSVGTPLLGNRADPKHGNLTPIKKVFPNARFVEVRVSYEVK
jgi:hypothetical protein